MNCPYGHAIDESAVGTEGTFTCAECNTARTAFKSKMSAEWTPKQETELIISEMHDAAREAIIRRYIAVLEHEIQELREVLLRQWASNHEEHCRWEWSHKGHCSWPIPDIITRHVSKEDVYAMLENKSCTGVAAY